jgi:nucleoside-diphosphate-sugar epimerase
MHVAVTGAGGFIGRHAVRALVRHGAEVTAMVRTPVDQALLPVRQVPIDLAAAGSDVHARLGRPDALLHLAWAGLPNYRSRTHLDQELPRQQRFLDACLDGGLSRLVVSGTCLEYGMQSGELSESRPALPDTHYGEAKHRLHSHLAARRSERPFGLTWLRLFYLHGEGQAPTSLRSQLRDAVSRGAESFDMSAGDQRRDYLPVEVAADMIARLTLAHDDAGVVNICSGRPATVESMARSWLAEWDCDLRLNLGIYPYTDYEAFEFWGDPRRLASLLGPR